MTSSLFIKKSTVSGTVPLFSEITQSELAINLGDGGLYYANVTSSQVELVRAGSASFAETASFALAGGDGGGGGGGGAFGGDFSGTFSGSLTGALTGTVEGTASHAVNAATASLLVGSIESASFAAFATSASFATTASFALNAGGITNTGSFTGSFTGGLQGTASAADHALFAVTSAFALNAGGGGGGGGGSGETFNYFDPDLPIEPTSSFNDEFNATSLDSKWDFEDNSGSLSASLDGEGLLRLTNNLTGAGVNRIMQPIPSGSWVLRAKVAMQSFVDQHAIGLCLENRVNGRLENLSLLTDAGPTFKKFLTAFTNPTTFSSTIRQVTMAGDEMNEWWYMQIAYDGTNYDYGFSKHGLDFTIFQTRTTSSFLLGAATHVGMQSAVATNPDFTGSFDWIRLGSGSGDINGGLRTVGSIGPAGASGSDGASGSEGAGATGSGETFNYFDADAIPDGVATSSLNDEFTESGTLGSKWEFLNIGSVSASQEGDSLVRFTSNLTAAAVQRFMQPAPSGSWTFRVKLALNSFDTQHIMGLCLENRAGGQLETLDIAFDTTPKKMLLAWNNPTSFNSTVLQVNMVGDEITEWWYIELSYDGANIGYRFSKDGVGFDDFITGRTTASFLSGAPTHIGIHYNGDPNTGSFDWFRIASSSADINGGFRTVGIGTVGPSGSDGAAGDPGGGVFGGDFSGSFSGSVTGTFVGELEATGTLTGTLIGSASFAENASAAVLAVSAVTAVTASNANTASFAETASFALNAGGGGGGDPINATGSGDTFNYFDVDAIISPTNSFNDEFTESGTLDLAKWQPFNTNSFSASLHGDSLLSITSNLAGGGNTIYTQPIPSGSWVIRMKCSYETYTTANQRFLGLVLQNQNNERMEAFHMVLDTAQPGRWLIERTTPATFNATVEIKQITALEMKDWFYLEIAFDGVADIYYNFSKNGIGWNRAFSTNRTTASFLQDLTHVGFAVGSNVVDYSASIDWIRMATGSISGSDLINGAMRSIESGGSFGIATGSFTGSFVGEFTGSNSFTGSFTGGLDGTATSASFSETASFALNAGGGGISSPYSYFDVDAPVEPTSSFNDEFHASGTLDSKWLIVNSGSMTASQHGEGVLSLTNATINTGQNLFLQPMPSGSWFMRMKVALTVYNVVSQNFVGLALYNANNERVEVVQLEHESAQKGRWLIQYNTPTSFQSVVNIKTLLDHEVWEWYYLQIAYDNGDLAYGISRNGIGFDDMFDSPLLRTTGSWLGDLTHIGIASACGNVPLSASIDWIRIATSSRALNGALRRVG